MKSKNIYSLLLGFFLIPLLTQCAVSKEGGASGQMTKYSALSYACRFYNSENKEWEPWEEWRECPFPVPILISNRAVEIYSADMQLYNFIIPGRIKDKDSYKLVKCRDVDGKRCELRFISEEGKEFLYIHRKDVIIAYEYIPVNK